MKRILWILSVVSLFVASYEFIKGRTNETILFTIWSFYLKYLSDQRK